MSVCVLLARGLPRIRLAVHDAPRTINVAPVVTGEHSRVALSAAVKISSEIKKLKAHSGTILLSNTFDGAW